jgi:energy-converting hydrogenase Eha subunit C
LSHSSGIRAIQPISLLEQGIVCAIVRAETAFAITG